MNSGHTQLTALFADDSRAAKAISTLRDTGWPVADVRGPIPSEAISKALGVKKSMVGWFTLLGGVIGFFLGYFLAVFTATRWDLMVSGKPVLSYVPFFIVGFEFTILFAVFGNVLGLILLARLPAYRDLPHRVTRCSSDRFGVVVDCDPGKENELRAILTQLGAEAPEESGTGGAS
jgi:hypothetical protein